MMLEPQAAAVPPRQGQRRPGQGSAGLLAHLLLQRGVASAVTELSRLQLCRRSIDDELGRLKNMEGTVCLPACAAQL
jgi:hypothetical protein